ncbi:zinc finger protein 37-like [Dunckerocampus dactyliophorus]|uniref:zinc finger protein 37-like n=1 Tax=Dunckerocampus dactyliophorus TaxID=161453 RepID=UPI00240530A5|nr:zinc finger protein 37-like [Dunckerocampus dactyliophorus]
MCKVQMLRALVNQRLTAAVEEIFVVLERTIAEYEGELSRTKEENERQRQLLDAVFNEHQDRRRKADVQHIKDEEEGEQTEGLEEFPVIGVPVKSEGDEDKCESEEKREVEPPSGSSTQHMTTEADGDHCGGSQADNLLAPLSEDRDDATSHSPDTDDEDAKADMTCHTDNTRHKCSQCDKSFNDSSNLKRHMRSHTGEKPYICSVCGKRFAHKGNLTTHTRTHTGEKPYSCSMCNTHFSDHSVLIRHMRRHTGEKPFTCSVCGKAFLVKGSLTAHTRTHTGEKPFKCLICGKNFSQKSHLRTHARTHAGEKTYSCSVCNASFGLRAALFWHMATHN